MLSISVCSVHHELSHAKVSSSEVYIIVRQVRYRVLPRYLRIRRYPDPSKRYSRPTYDLPAYGGFAYVGTRVGSSPKTLYYDKDIRLRIIQW